MLENKLNMLNYGLYISRKGIFSKYKVYLKSSEAKTSKHHLRFPSKMSFNFFLHFKSNEKNLPIAIKSEITKTTHKSLNK